MSLFLQLWGGKVISFLNLYDFCECHELETRIFPTCASRALRQSEFLKCSIKFLWDVPLHRIEVTVIVRVSESSGDSCV